MMFVHTRQSDRRDRARRRSALLLALLLQTTTAGLLFVSGDSQAVGLAPDAPGEEILVELRAERLPPAPPAPTPGAPGPAAAAPASQAAPPPPPPAAEETPPEPPPAATLAELWKEATAAVQPQSLPAPTGLPGDGSGQGPETDGGGGGGGGCPPGATCDGDVLSLSAADVVARRRVAPVYPEAAKALNLPEVRCRVDFLIDEKGTPKQVTVEGCPAVFHAEVLSAAYRWSFYPARNAAGEATAARFTLALTFRLR